MPRELVALKLDVGLDPQTGHAKYPDFNKISSATRKGMDWSKYIDIHGVGMHYDKICGHQDEGATPYGHQCCCICVPSDFAAEALLMFPDVVSKMTDIEFEAFHDGRAHAHEPDEHIDIDALNGLVARRNLMALVSKTAADTNAIAAIEAKITKALDPTDKTEAGVKINTNKTWAQVAANKGVTIKKVITI
jgi:hypothetical protein